MTLGLLCKCVPFGIDVFHPVIIRNKTYKTHLTNCSCGCYTSDCVSNRAMPNNKQIPLGTVCIKHSTFRAASISSSGLGRERGELKRRERHPYREEEERKDGRADGSRSSQGVFTKLVALIKAVTCRSVVSMHRSATLTPHRTGAEL
jgi:hypothetical protein